ncbi:MAG: Cell morphogenesis protein PAG1 [Chrysothrix sp. TS-e1954]|nr:MAG: Cell morphogenesis protein PAG1 [Chrysothrix sp. TS-e1954]
MGLAASDLPVPSDDRPKLPKVEPPSALDDSSFTRSRGSSGSGAYPSSQHQRTATSPLTRSRTLFETKQNPRPSYDASFRRQPSFGRPHVRRISPTIGLPLSRSQSNTAVGSLNVSPAIGYGSPNVDSVAGLSPASVGTQEERTVSSSATTVVDGSEFSLRSPTLINSTSFESERVELHSNVSVDLQSRKSAHKSSGIALTDSLARSRSRRTATSRTSVDAAESFALQQLFAQFEDLADDKINACVADSIQKHEPDLDRLFCSGRDPNFDRVISALAHLSRSGPRLAIDKTIWWYTSKYSPGRQSSSRAVSPAPQTQATRDISTQSVRSHVEGQTSNVPEASVMKLDMQTPYNVSEERRSLAGSYIMCRLLIEVISQTTLAHATLDKVEELEDISFHNQTRHARDDLARSPMKQAVWNAYVRLFGALGEFDFGGVSSKYLRELRKHHIGLSLKGHVSKDAETRTEDILRALSHIHLNVSLQPQWKQFCDFMLNLADLFAAVHGQRCKSAYGRSIEKLLLAVATRPGSNLEDQAWKALVRRLYDRSTQLASKPKYWQNAFCVQVVVTCVAPLDVFTSRFQPMINTAAVKLRERGPNKVIALKAICRLVWTFFKRSTDNEQVRSRIVEDIAKNVFQGKRSVLSSDSNVAEPLIELARIIGSDSADTCMRTIVFPLLNAEALLSSKEIKVDSFDPVKVVIGIPAFLAILACWEKKEAPSFPSGFADEALRIEDWAGSNTSSQDPRTPAQTAKCQTHIEERLSKPVQAIELSERMAVHYNAFCKILGILLFACDEALGAQAAREDKINASTPKTPMIETWSFARREDGIGTSEDRETVFELYHLTVQALPRCFVPQIQFSPMVNVLCTGTSHVRNSIAQASTKSLMSVAKQGHAQFVVSRFALFMAKFETRLSTLNDGRVAGYVNVDNTLQLFLNLLQIWISQVEKDVKKLAYEYSREELKNQRNSRFDSSFWGQVDRVEVLGLFFLCSSSSSTRALAVDILDLVTQFDAALEMNNPRISKVLTEDSGEILDVTEQDLSTKDSSTLSSLQAKLAHRALTDLCRSAAPEDIALWYKVYPRFIKAAFLACPLAVTETQDDIRSRLANIYPVLNNYEETSRQLQRSLFDVKHASGGALDPQLPENTLINQWKLYLIFVCVTLTKPGVVGDYVKNDANHVRQSSKSSQMTPESFATASEVFTNVIPMLYAHHPSVREAAVTGLGSINVNVYKPLLQTIASMAHHRGDDTTRQLGAHQRGSSSPRRSDSYDVFHTEVAQVYHLTSHFLRYAEVYSDGVIMSQVSHYVHSLALSLQQPESRHNRTKIKQHYCGLLENFFAGINKTLDPMTLMSFQARRAAYVLLEQWYYGPAGSDRSLNKEQTSQRGAAGARESRKLRDAASSAMAALCAGPMIHRADNSSPQRFQVLRILEWIDTLFKNDGAKHHATGRRALGHLIVYNRQFPYFSEIAIEKLYVQATSAGLESYLKVLFEVFRSEEVPDVPFWKILSALLFILGNTESQIRMMSARLLRTFEERQGNSSKLQDLDISISDKTRVVNRSAQFEMSERLVKQHPDLAFRVVSELAKYFIDLQPDLQRNMVNILIPWLRSIKLDRTSSGVLSAPTYVTLVNLFHITVRCHSTLDYEIQALWHSLATKEHAANVALILDFLLSLTLDRKDQTFLRFAKQIVVHLSSSQAGGGVIDTLLLCITPKKMLPETPTSVEPPSDAKLLPYVTPLEHIFPNTTSQATMSTGQLALILLVDLVVADVKLATDRLPSLLQVVLVLWDHHMSVVQEQAREMLVHLIHELVISRMPSTDLGDATQTFETFINQIRGHHSDVVWDYDDNNFQQSQYDLPQSMHHVVSKTTSLFTLTYPGIDLLWGKVTLDWAINCPVRHLACRSLQLYRCLQTPIDQQSLSEFITRLASMIADDHPDVQIYCMEIIRAIRTMLLGVETEGDGLLPQILWATCGCLESDHEREFLEGLALLDTLLGKVDFGKPSTVDAYMHAKPVCWDWTGVSITTLVVKGCRSELCYDKTFDTLNRLIQSPSNKLVGGGGRLLLSVLAMLPRLLRSFEDPHREQGCLEPARNLAIESANGGYFPLRAVLDDFGQNRFRDSDTFLDCVLSGLQPLFLHFELNALDLLMSLLMNPLVWVKHQSLRILGQLTAKLDLSQPKIASRGGELVQPLLNMLSSESSAQVMDVLDRMLPALGAAPDKRSMHQKAPAQRLLSSPMQNAADKSLWRTESASSGWSVPMPAASRRTLRHNLQALQSMHATKDTQAESGVPTPELEFWQDESSQLARFPDGFHASSADDYSLAESSMGELVSKLDSLDDFFDSEEETSPMQPYDSPAVSTPETANLTRARETSYDYPESNTGGKRDQSFDWATEQDMDTRRPPMRAAAAMSPSAFSVSKTMPRRPSIGGRSMTLPVVNQHTRPDLDLDVPNLEAEPFSDDDLSAGRANLSTNANPSTRPRSNSRIRNGLKRLTSGERHRRPTLKAQVDESPEVPRVPDFYLQNPKSSDL